MFHLSHIWPVFFPFVYFSTEHFLHCGKVFTISTLFLLWCPSDSPSPLDRRQRPAVRQRSHQTRCTHCQGQAPMYMCILTDRRTDIQPYITTERHTYIPIADLHTYIDIYTNRQTYILTYVPTDRCTYRQTYVLVHIHVYIYRYAHTNRI